MALVLASSSPIRRQMLEQAGVAFKVQPAAIDEAATKGSCADAARLATALAEAKALEVSKGQSGDLIIGSDSIVSVEGRLFDKPLDREQAAEHLAMFSGLTMTLTSGVALARHGKVEWSYCDTATLKVRALSARFIEDYLQAEWPEVGYCVGVFRLEGRGVQLFDRIDGSFFTILGMPLLPLLGALRERGELQS